MQRAGAADRNLLVNISRDPSSPRRKSVGTIFFRTAARFERISADFRAHTHTHTHTHTHRGAHARHAANEGNERTNYDPTRVYRARYDSPTNAGITG